jgi:hypothetical protein
MKFCISREVEIAKKLEKDQEHSYSDWIATQQALEKTA